MHVPPENQGQIVEVSYGWRDDRLYRRVLDKSDRSEAWAVARDSKALRNYQESSSELWNEAPPEKITWKPCEPPKAKEV